MSKNKAENIGIKHYLKMPNFKRVFTNDSATSELVQL